MTTLPSLLEAPVLLLAMPQVLDPYFHKSVVLLIHHDEEGSFGFIINRPTGIRVAEILGGMEIPWSGDPAAVTFFGGPVQPQLGSVLCPGLPPEVPAEDFAGVELAPGVTVTQHVGDLQMLADAAPLDFRLILGYAGWGNGQLIDEIQRNDWLIAPPSHELIFRTDSEALWEAALRSVGVDPVALPAWSRPGSGDAN
ncbi:MAG: YqgE/AlgH family protein [Acidobacteria bacterium]|nr:YqgE/AlgH family protein [Acidobacteriota bacterium]